MHNGFCQQWSIVFVKLFLGKKLKQLRGNKSQVNAAKIMEVSQQCWQAWESNTNELSATTIHGICTKFNCSADWLLGLNEKPQPQPSLPDTPKLCIECTKKDETIANLSGSKRRCGKTPRRLDKRQDGIALRTRRPRR